MRIGIVGDLHAPWVHPMYLQFCSDMFEEWNVDRIHFVGDVVDLHALSFWDHDPSGMSAGDETLAGLQVVQQWYDTFPKATVCVGNHDERHYRLARKHGLPDKFLRSYADVWQTPSWKWAFEHKFDEVLYEHGTGTSGRDCALNLAIQKRSSVVIGHVHCYGGVKWHSNPFDVIFGLNAGCGIDCSSYAFAYGKAFAVRPTLGCGIVIDGEAAYFELMPASPGQKYHRSRAGRRRRRPYKFLKSLVGGNKNDR